MSLDIHKYNSYNLIEIVNATYKEYIINLDCTNKLKRVTKQEEVSKKRSFEELSIIEKVKSLEKKKKDALDNKFKLRRIINCNYNEKSSFLTLTFRNHYNEEDVEKANSELGKFRKRLGRYFKSKELELKYLTTWELTEKGRIHYHLILFDVPYLDRKKLESLWGQGFIDIKHIRDNIDNVALYISKYFTKDIEKKAKYKKSFFYSQNLKKPVVSKKLLTVDELNDIIVDDEKITYQKEFESAVYLARDENGNEIFEKVRKLYIIKKIEEEEKKELSAHNSSTAKDEEKV